MDYFLLTSLVFERMTRVYHNFLLLRMKYLAVLIIVPPEKPVVSFWTYLKRLTKFGTKVYYLNLKHMEYRVNVLN